MSSLHLLERWPDQLLGMLLLIDIVMRLWTRMSIHRMGLTIVRHGQPYFFRILEQFAVLST